MVRFFAIVAGLGFLGVGLFTGCESEQEVPDSGAGTERVNLPHEWWKNPGAVDDHMAAVGTSPCPNSSSQGAARTMAEADAREKIAASTEARITSLVENWSKIVGDTKDQATFTSLINNEAFTRQFVDRSVKGTRPIAYKYVPEEKTLYALLVVQNPEAWMVEFNDNSLEKAADVFYWTQAQKEDFAKKMDAVQERYAKEDRDFRNRLLPPRAAPEGSDSAAEPKSQP